MRGTDSLILATKHSKSRLIRAKLVGGEILIFSMIDFAFVTSGVAGMICKFMPTVMVIGNALWRTFVPIYIGGEVIRLQVLIFPFAALVSVTSVIAVCAKFRRRQVENSHRQKISDFFKKSIDMDAKPLYIS
jgi:hypothetical protein